MKVVEKVDGQWVQLTPQNPESHAMMAPTVSHMGGCGQTKMG